MHPATTYEEFVEGLRPATGRDHAAEAARWRGTTGQIHVPVRKSKTTSGALEAYLRHQKKDLFDPREADAAPAKLASDKSAETEKPAPSQKPAADTPPLPDPRAWFWNAPRRTPESTTSAFAMEDGFFLRVCAEAVHCPHQLFVVLLDEFNRCNIPKVMGDLLTCIESSKRATWNRSEKPSENQWDVSDCPMVTLPGSGRLFFVPDNVYVVATMNSSDRSVGSLDAALRRRFALERVWPLGFGPEGTAAGEHNSALTDAIRKVIEVGFDHAGRDWLDGSIAAWTKLNFALHEDLGPDGMLGHSPLFDLAKALVGGSDSDHRYFGAIPAPETAAGEHRRTVVRHYWEQHIIPQLIEILDASHQHKLLGKLAGGGASLKDGNEAAIVVVGKGEKLTFTLTHNDSHPALLQRIGIQVTHDVVAHRVETPDVETETPVVTEG